jgi:hypothetical protein
MGYTTYFTGSVSVEPPLNEKEISYLKKFNESRRMDRKNGPYFVEGSGFMGQGRDNDIRDHNRPPEGQPGLWCQWVPTEDGTAIEWDEGEKFYSAGEWMLYIIEHFIGDDPIAKQVDPENFGFLQGHKVNGEILAEGEEQGDIWKIVVDDNAVTELEAKIVWD